MPKMNPIGIPNLGNTCFRSSAIQLLFKMPELVDVVENIGLDELISAIRVHGYDLLRQMITRAGNSKKIMDDIIARGVDVKSKVLQEERYALDLNRRSYILEDILDSDHLTATELANSGIVEIENLINAHEVLSEFFSLMDEEEIDAGDLENVSSVACRLSPGQVEGEQQDAMDTIQQLLDPLIDFFPAVKSIVSTSIALVTEDGDLIIDEDGDTKYRIVSIARYDDMLNANLAIPYNMDGRGVKAFIIRLGSKINGGGHYITVAMYNDRWYLIDDNAVRSITGEEARKLLSRAYIILYGR